MKIEYRDVESGRVMDTVTITRSSVSYQTGKAKDMVDHVVRGPGGHILAMAKFKSWSNGYVKFVERV